MVELAVDKLRPFQPPDILQAFQQGEQLQAQQIDLAFKRADQIRKLSGDEAAISFIKQSEALKPFDIKVLPEPGEPFTLSPGEVRFGPKGKEIARVKRKPLPQVEQDVRFVADQIAAAETVRLEQKFGRRLTQPEKFEIISNALVAARNQVTRAPQKEVAKKLIVTKVGNVVVMTDPESGEEKNRITIKDAGDIKTGAESKYYAAVTKAAEQGIEKLSKGERFLITVMTPAGRIEQPLPKSKALEGAENLAQTDLENAMPKDFVYRSARERKLGNQYKEWRRMAWDKYLRGEMEDIPPSITFDEFASQLAAARLAALKDEGKSPREIRKILESEGYKRGRDFEVK